jgi:hypothetical protein
MSVPSVLGPAFQQQAPWRCVIPRAIWKNERTLGFRNKNRTLAGLPLSFETSATYREHR